MAAATASASQPSDCGGQRQPTNGSVDSIPDFLAAGQDSPAVALVKLASDICGIEQRRAQERLQWSRKSARLAVAERAERPSALTNTASAQRPAGRMRPAAPPVPQTARTPSAPSSNRAWPRVGLKGVVPSEDQQPATARLPREYVMRSGQDALVLGRGAEKANKNLPQMERSQAQQPQTLRKGPHAPLTSSATSLSMSSSTKSLLRLAEACTEAGLFIIPDVPLPPGSVSKQNPSDGPPDLVLPPKIAISVSESGDKSPQVDGGGDAQAKSSASWDTVLKVHENMSRIFRTASGHDLGQKELQPSVAVSKTENCLGLTPRASMFAGSGENPHSRSSFAVPSGATGHRWSMAVGKLQDEKVQQQLQEIANQANEEEQLKYRRKEKRHELQQRHMHQLTQLQELIKTLQQLQPQEQPAAIAEPLAMFRAMFSVGGGPAAAEKKEAPSAESEKDKNTLVTSERPSVRKSVTQDGFQGLSRKSRSFRMSTQSSFPDSLRDTLRDTDTSDVSLPPLCGNVGRPNAARREEPPCSLAKSCSAQKSPGISPRLSALSSRCFGSNSEEDAGARSNSKTNKWKSKIGMVRLMGRMGGIAQLNEEERLDDEYEGLMGTSALTQEDVLRLGAEYNLPAEQIVRARRLFARNDKGRKGEIGGEEVQHVLREMYKSLHPTGTVPNSLQTSPSTWGSSRFPELLHWLSRSVLDESAVVPQEHGLARDLARQYGISVSDVEEVKDMFDRFDTDSAGYLDQAKFGAALHTVLRAPKGIEVPTSRINFYWKEVDKERTGRITFERFFCWYKSGAFDETSSSCPFAASVSLRSPRGIMGGKISFGRSVSHNF